MARRDRVPRHKSHNKKKNKNPKLSPFQREQKRAKLANQAPTAGSDDLSTIPHSQRRVYQYLMEKKARDDARRQRQLEAQKAKEEEEDVQEDVSSSEEAEETASGSAIAPQKAKIRNAACPAAPEKMSKRRRVEVETLEEESCDDDEENDAALEETRASKTKAKALVSSSAATMSKKQQKKNKNPFGAASLNAELIDEVAPARRVVLAAPAEADADGEDRPLTLEERIAKKKLKKHQRKAEQRRQQVTERMQQMEAELSKLVQRKKKKGREDENLAFERKLRQMQAERAREVKAAKVEAVAAATRKRKRGETEYDADGRVVGVSAKQAHDAEDASSSPSSSSATPAPTRKHISFDESVETHVVRGPDGMELPHEAMRFPKDNRSRRSGGDGFAKPTDFYEMVDVVRFGERVEAPPVFDVVPNRHAAISKLAKKLEAEETAAGAKRLKLLSGGGGLGEKKRLARMGLAPAITGMIVAGSSDERRRAGRGAGVAPVDKEAIQAKEMAQLRAHVMAAYQNNKRKSVEDRKGVDMRHEFPRLA